MVNIRHKGQRAERELCSMFNIAFDLDCQRNLMQSMVGGDDLTSVPYFSVECKSHEKPAVATWWKQSVNSATRGSKVPVVCWKVKRKGWKVLMAIQDVPPSLWVDIKEPEKAESRLFDNLIWLTWDQFKLVYKWYSKN